MGQPLVSIITPSYNQGPFIEDAILSIQHQTYRAVEHIVVDGGSTDATLEILERFGGTYALRWTSERDSGMYDAINKGLKSAQGDILAYLNCDDLYLPWSIELAVEHLSVTPIIYGDLIRLDEATNTISPAFSPAFSRGFFGTFGFISQPTVFFRREVFERIGLFDHVNFRLVADCDYWLRCATAGMEPRKIWEFIAIEREHDLTQRTVDRGRLHAEFAKLRRKYSSGGATRYNLYRGYNHFHWRTMLLSYRIGIPINWWSRMRRSRFMELDWSDVWAQWTSSGLDYKPRCAAHRMKWIAEWKRR